MNQRVVVFPRGINVGGHNKVPMQALRADLESAGFSAVTTLMASGNIIVTAPGGGGSDPDAEIGTVCARVREIIRTSSGTDVECLARSADQLRGIAELNPLGGIADDGSRHTVTFLSEPLPEELVRQIEAEDYSPNVHTIVGRELYSWAPNGVRTLVLNDAMVMKRAGVLATARNWNTIVKIVAAL